MVKRSTSRSGAAYDLSLETALDLLHGDSLTLDRIAEAAHLSDDALTEFRQNCDSPADWLRTLLTRHDPTAAFAEALSSVNGDTAEDLLRSAVRQAITVAQAHKLYLIVASLEAERFQGNTLNGLVLGLLPAANKIFDRLKHTGEIRPLPEWLIMRVLASALIGFMVSDSMMPQGLQWAARLMPARMWTDGLTDILLYGILEDKT